MLGSGPPRVPARARAVVLESMRACSGRVDQDKPDRKAHNSADAGGTCFVDLSKRRRGLSGRGAWMSESLDRHGQIGH